MNQLTVRNKVAKLYENNSRRFYRLTVAGGAAAVVVLSSSPVWSDPHGGVVVAGSASIQQSPGVTTVNQGSDRAVINWDGFSIDKGELTQFKQPGQGSIALNRVVGVQASQIMGQLNANGNVWLVNPNGVMFGPNAQVDVHGLIATTADIADKDFLAGQHDFSIPSPNENASVVNAGSISLGAHGLGALVAPHVRNDGVIAGRMSQVVLAGTPTFTVDFHGDGLIQFATTSPMRPQVDSKGALVENSGILSAESGLILITADAAAGFVGDVINTSGVVEARSFTADGGTIALNGGSAGTVTVAGVLDVSGAESDASGGSIKMLGEELVITHGTSVDASGGAGGGQVLIGGNAHGAGPETKATRTKVASGARISADATAHGDGGDVVVWANDTTQVHGTLSARGGPRGGDGGFIETSAKQLIVTRAADASAPNGQGGVWLLDPADITIVPDSGFELGQDQVSADVISTALSNGTDVTLDTNLATPPDPLALGHITLDSDASIVKESSPTTTPTLTFLARTDIRLGGGRITSTAGALNVILNADSDADGAGAISLDGAEISSNGGNIVLGGGTDPLSTPAFGHDIVIPSGVIIRNGAALNSSGGDISIRGTGAGGIGAQRGILVDGASIRSGNGSLNLVGIGGIGVSPSLASTGGISIQNAAVLEATGSGTITMTGSGGTGGLTPGIFIEGSSEIRSEDGALTITGTGGDATDMARGINIQASGVVKSTGSGAVMLDGQGGTGADAIGVFVHGGSKVSSDEGALTITGKGGVATEFALGISIQAEAIVESTNGSAVTLDGLGGTSNDANSIVATSGSSISTAGTLTLVGHSGDVLLDGTNDFGMIVITSAHDASVTEADAVSLGPVTATGGLKIEAEGNVQVVGALQTQGTIDIASSGGFINSSGVDIDSAGTNGAGDVELTAAGNIITGDIFTSTASVAGDIVLTSDASIDTSAGELDTATDIGDAGNVSIDAARDVTTARIFARSLDGNGGAITISSDTGFIDTSAGELNSISATATAGAIRLEAPGNLNTTHIFASGLNNATTGALNAGSSGGITLISNEGNITTGDLLSPTESDFGSAGDSNPIVVIANSGSITVNGVAWTFSNAAIAGGSGNAGNGGDVTFSARDDIEIEGSIATQSRSDNGNAENGAVVSIISALGDIILADAIDSLATGTGSAGHGGLVQLVANNGDVSTSGINATTSDATSSGGAVVVDSGGVTTLNAPVRTSGETIRISTNTFINNFGPEVFDAGSGRYLVYSSDPALDKRGLSNDDINKRYNFSFNGENPEPSALPPGESFFLYETDPTLTISAAPQSRLFGSADLELALTVSGLIDGDTLDDAALIEEIVISTNATETSDVGTYDLSLGPETLASDVGYDVEISPNPVPNLTITPAPLTITANNASRLLFEPNPPFSASFNSFVVGDDVMVLATPLMFRTLADSDSPPGNYAIVPFGATARNYAISFTNGTLAIFRTPGEDDGNVLKPDVEIRNKLDPQALAEPPAQLYSVPTPSFDQLQAELLFSNDGNRSLWNLSVGAATLGVQ